VSVVGFRARNHPQQLALRGADVEVDDRTTTAEMFAPLHARFGFTIDVAASPANARCDRFYTVDEDGLAQPWAGEVVWCNPPYSDIRPWVEKAWAEADAARGIVMLLPANRTEQGWWQDLVEPFRDRGGSGVRVEFLRGRHRFIRAGSALVGPNERPPFGCCLLIWAPAKPVLP
jgi:phage N-6-adenine-methyltransferase